MGALRLAEPVSSPVKWGHNTNLLGRTKVCPHSVGSACSAKVGCSHGCLSVQSRGHTGFFRISLNLLAASRGPSCVPSASMLR